MDDMWEDIGDWGMPPRQRAFSQRRRRRKSLAKHRPALWAAMPKDSEGRGICPGCKDPFRLGEHLEVDHIHPYEKGGSSDISNLQLLCRVCNNIKSDHDMDYLWANQPKQPEQPDLF